MLLPLAEKATDMEFLVEIAYFVVVSVTGNVTVIVHSDDSTPINKMQEVLN
jgi:hypothetical protein